jgi:hypothetical protein
VLPLDRLLGIVSDPVELRHRWEAYRAGYPAAMTRCVRSAGYSEFTEPPPDIPPDRELRRSGPNPSAEIQLIEEHGYGLSENLELQIVNARTARRRDDAAVPAWRSALDPAQQRALLEVERQCQQDATARHPNPNSLAVDEAEYFEVQTIRRTVLAAPEIRQLWDRWATCMLDHGYRVADREDLVRRLDEATHPILDAIDAATRSAGGPLPDDDPTLATARRQTAELARRERAAAATDVACAAPLDLDQQLFTLQARLEQQYIDDHADEIRELIARSGTSR